jgi:hypothetical protein
MILLMCLGCSSGDTSIEAELYLDEVIELLENNSINKSKIDWNEFRISVFEKAGNAQSIQDTYPAVTYAISKLGDSHSYFSPVIDIEKMQDKPLPILLDEPTPEDIGYVRVPFCIGTDDEMNAYVSLIQTKIIQQIDTNLKGWIIDLRGNFGGNMWPMLLSIEPLMGNGTLGYFVDADNNYKAWKLASGKAFIGDALVYENLEVKELNLSKSYIAVLTNNETASSGEAIAVAFKNRINTKSFGGSTFGVSTGCVSHQLSDGSIINLAESVFADGSRKRYGYSIAPDMETDEKDALKKGIEWIYEMNKTTIHGM